MKLGLIGLLGHQKVVLEGVRQLGDVELVAVSESDANRRSEFIKSEPLARSAQPYDDWRHLVEHSMMDVACICDENGRHADQIIALAQRGIDIVTEKPLSVSLEELERIRSALAASKSRLTMLLTMRHEGKYVTFRRLVRQGAVGPICQVTVQKSYRLGSRPEWQRSRARLGGTIPYIGIHAIDLVRWTTGMDFTHVAAFHSNLGKPEMKETEDNASILLRMTNGASATVRLDYLRPAAADSHGDDRLRIAGGDGVIEVAQSFPDVQLVTSRQSQHRIEAESAPNLFVAFVEAVRAGRPHPIPAEDCLRVTELVLLARQAADERRLLEIH